MSFVLALLTFIAIPSAFSQADEGFFPVGDLPASHNEPWLRSVAQASQPLKLGGATECSGQFISSDGYYLTAFHCITDSCPPSKLGAIDLGWNAEMSYSVLKITDETPRNFVCQGLSVGRYHDPELVYTGHGFSMHSSDDVAALPKNIQNEMQKYNDDVAILKFKVPKNVPCVQRAPDELHNGEPLWLIGYPAATPLMRDVGCLPDGQTQLVSFGQDIENIMAYTALDTDLSRSQQTDLSLIFGSHYFSSSFDGTFGDSGGMVLNKRGELVGIVSQGHSAGPGFTAYGNILSVRINDVYRELVRVAGSQKATQVFSCVKP
jgi:hypothetical protein